MTSAPGGNAPPGFRWGAVWQVNYLAIENNVIELGQNKHPATTYGWGTAVRNLGDGTFPQYRFRRASVRENIIRQLAPDPDVPQALGINTNGAENLNVQKNVLEMTHLQPIQGQGNESASFFNNQTPAGTSIPGFDNEGGLRRYDELATRIEDSLLASL